MEWEHKRSKWTKRWLELREHCLWISKKQGAKDATLLCTLSNFDAYLVTRLHKSPRPFIFSMKSVQNMRLFERPQDYHHVFCCDPEEGRDWLQNILLARVSIPSMAFNCTLMILCSHMSYVKNVPFFSIKSLPSIPHIKWLAVQLAVQRQRHCSICPSPHRPFLPLSQKHLVNRQQRQRASNRCQVRYWQRGPEPLFRVKLTLLNDPASLNCTSYYSH